MTCPSTYHGAWTLEEAVELAQKVEAVCPPFGYHVALTGGLLYRTGPRKDCDLVLYRIGGWPGVYDWQGLVKELGSLLITDLAPSTGCRVWKGKHGGKPVDLIFPEFYQGDY